jgi:hypothetical protein
MPLRSADTTLTRLFPRPPIHRRSWPRTLYNARDTVSWRATFATDTICSETGRGTGLAIHASGRGGPLAKADANQESTHCALHAPPDLRASRRKSQRRKAGPGRCCRGARSGGHGTSIVPHKLLEDVLDGSRPGPERCCLRARVCCRSPASVRRTVRIPKEMTRAVQLSLPTSDASTVKVKPYPDWPLAARATEPGGTEDIHFRHRQCDGGGG